MERRKDGWTTEQDQLIVALRADRAPWGQISERVGRTVDACGARYRVLIPAGDRVRHISLRWWSEDDDATLEKLSAEKKTPREISAIMRRSLCSIYKKLEKSRAPGRKIYIEMDPRVEVPAACLEDRERRAAAERNLTAAFFGDPPPGFSALDRREARA